jgi:hypothetical protein
MRNLDAIASLPEHDIESLLLSEVKRYEPYATTIEEVDWKARRLVYQLKGGQLFAREFDATLQSGGNTELTIASERTEMRAVTTGYESASDVDPLDGYAVALAKLKGAKRTAPDLRTGERVYLEPPSGYEAGLKQLKEAGR